MKQRGTPGGRWLRRSFTSCGFGQVGASFWLTGIPCRCSTARVERQRALGAGPVARARR
jgi:hypothetical protein